jgi:hypothetical protein
MKRENQAVSKGAGFPFNWSSPFGSRFNFKVESHRDIVIKSCHLSLSLT